MAAVGYRRMEIYFRALTISMTVVFAFLVTVTLYTARRRSGLAFLVPYALNGLMQITLIVRFALYWREGRRGRLEK